MEVKAPSTAPALDNSTRLALDRTRLAHDRTMMAWVRTATSLISFGFTIYKFFQFEVDKNALKVHGAIGPREFALILISLGIVSLVVATVEQHRDRKILRAMVPDLPRSTATVLAALIAALGVVSLVAVFLRQ